IDQSASCRSASSALCLLCDFLISAGSIQVFGYEGGDVNVSCPYDRGFEGRQKYLCNNDCRYADVLITTSQGSSGKYSIHDDKTTRVFTVIISDLHLGDAGKYWCGVTIIGRDINTERNLIPRLWIPYPFVQNSCVGSAWQSFPFQTCFIIDCPVSSLSCAQFMNKPD
uniref:Immunoglobulin V-set domain-containing protein n=1 Tax=Xiphophorus couchianus TaxID=32473 RepID=A0A3B5L632_9TELE